MECKALVSEFQVGEAHVEMTNKEYRAEQWRVKELLKTEASYYERTNSYLYD